MGNRKVREQIRLINSRCMNAICDGIKCSKCEISSEYNHLTGFRLEEVGKWG